MPHHRRDSDAPADPKAAYLSGPRILPSGLTGSEPLGQVMAETFLAYNAARLREAGGLLARKMLEPDVTVALSLAGALTPAGLGASCVVPLIEAGFVDWIVATGANLYHDLHFAFDLPMHVGTQCVSDADLRACGVVRIYDILFDYEVLAETDRRLRTMLTGPEFDRAMGSAEFHYLLGARADEAETEAGRSGASVLAAAYRAAVPVYTSSPGDSSIGMNVAAVALDGHGPRLLPSRDVNETAAIVLAAKRAGGKSGVLLMGGGSPKNFVLQTEPQLQEVLGLEEAGHDYFLQVTDARPDTGGLSGATPHEAVSWGKVDPNRLPDAVVCYTDTTIALPLLTHYALANHEPREPKRLYDRRDDLLEALAREVAATK